MGKSEKALADITHWIGGRRVAGSSVRTGKVFNPATGDITGAVRFADAAVVDAAVQAALRPCRRGAKRRRRIAHE